MAKYKIIPSSRTIVQSPISIGHKAEKGVEAIEFDVTAWVETYGSGTLTVIMRRWGDAIPYPIALEIDENNKATWTLSDIDTAKAGMAYAQLSYIVGETVVKKSDIYTFRVMDSLTGEGEPPEAYESWLEHLTHLAAEAMAEVLDIEGIVTDKTLTVDGGIADAKATGEALAEKVDAADYSELSARVGANTIAIAEKADRSTTYTKTEVDALIDEVEVETDTTLAVSGAPADAKKVGDELSDIKADLGAHGFTDDQKNALLACFGNIAWLDESKAEQCLAGLEDALWPYVAELPEGYTRVLALKSTGSQYIDTGLKYSAGDLIEIIASGITFDPSYEQWYFGALDSNTAVIGLKSLANDGNLYFRYGNAANTSVKKVVTSANIYNIELNDNTMYIDGVRVSSYTKKTYTMTKTMYLFAYNGSGTQTTLTRGMSVYGFKVTGSDGILKQSLVPCLDDNNVPCMYDKISKNTIYNAGSGVFDYEVETEVQS